MKTFVFTILFCIISASCQCKPYERLWRPISAVLKDFNSENETLREVVDGEIGDSKKPFSTHKGNVDLTGYSRSANCKLLLHRKSDYGNLDSNTYMDITFNLNSEHRTIKVVFYDECHDPIFETYMKRSIGYTFTCKQEIPREVINKFRYFGIET